MPFFCGSVSGYLEDVRKLSASQTFWNSTKKKKSSDHQQMKIFGLDENDKEMKSIMYV